VVVDLRMPPGKGCYLAKQIVRPYRSIAKPIYGLQTHTNQLATVLFAPLKPPPSQVRLERPPFLISISSNNQAARRPNRLSFGSIKASDISANKVWRASAIEPGLLARADLHLRDHRRPKAAFFNKSNRPKERSLKSRIFHSQTKPISPPRTGIVFIPAFFQWHDACNLPPCPPANLFDGTRRSAAA
jgi:hypothetical protein